MVQTTDPRLQQQVIDSIYVRAHTLGDVPRIASFIKDERSLVSFTARRELRHG